MTAWSFETEVIKRRVTHLSTLHHHTHAAGRFAPNAPPGRWVSGFCGLVDIQHSGTRELAGSGRAGLAAGHAPRKLPHTKDLGQASPRLSPYIITARPEVPRCH